MKYVAVYASDDILAHHGVLGQKWGVRRYQNKDGTLTPEGKDHQYRVRRTRENMKTTDDANRIVRSLSDQEKKLLGADLEEDWIEKKYDAETNYNVAKRFIESIGDTPISMLEVWDNAGDIGEIAIATDSNYRGQGAASKNVQKAISWLNSNQNKTVNELLWSAHQDNIASQNLAKKNGFTEIPNTFYGDEMNPKYKYYRYEKKGNIK